MTTTARPISRWPVPELAALPADIRSRIQEVQDKAGFVPNVFLTLAHRPDEFRAFFAYHDALMLRESGLTKGEKEMIVVATSGANECVYCVVAHGAILRIRAKNPLVALAFIRSLGSQEAATEQYKQAPRAIRESLMFPYEEGSAWATQVYRRGGWQLVSQAFTKLPQSSEQILHPEKYFSGDAPTKVTLPELKTLLGFGWKKIDTDVNGEWGCYLILDQFLNNAEESKRAAAGWGGDRFAVYEGSAPGQVFVVQMTAWDTDNDAKEFFESYEKRTLKRYPDAKPSTSNPATEQRQWETSQGTVVMERRGTRVLILEGLPKKADVNAFTRITWQ
jgi:uncharacterized peroxidase-related enzyme